MRFVRGITSFSQKIESSCQIFINFVCNKSVHGGSIVGREMRPMCSAAREMTCLSRIIKFPDIAYVDSVENQTPSCYRVIKSRRLRWAGNVACMVERQDEYIVLVGKPEGRRPL